MKHLSRKHKIALVELVVLVLLVVWFIAPRPLTRAMAGDGFDPAAVTQIQADLTAFQGGEGRTLTFSQGEPAFSQLMDCSSPSGTSPTTWTRMPSGASPWATVWT